jgi:hypothetical protein
MDKKTKRMAVLKQATLVSPVKRTLEQGKGAPL